MGNIAAETESMEQTIHFAPLEYCTRKGENLVWFKRASMDTRNRAGVSHAQYVRSKVRY
jgi:hypothetical protein